MHSESTWADHCYADGAHSLQFINDLQEKAKYINNINCANAFFTSPAGETDLQAVAAVANFYYYARLENGFTIAFSHALILQTKAISRGEFTAVNSPILPKDDTLCSGRVFSKEKKTQTKHKLKCARWKITHRERAFCVIFIMKYRRFTAVNVEK